MEEAFKNEDVKSRLILSGLKELSEYGARDFSLRRAADAAGVSCAAPYRYFKSKEEYVAEIIAYLSSRWELMAKEIVKSYRPAGYSLFAELSAANVKFWVSHKNAASCFFIAGEENPFAKSWIFDKTLTEKLYEFFFSEGFTDALAKEKVTAVRALLIGYVALISSEELSNGEGTFISIKKQIDAFVFQNCIAN